MVIDRKPAKEGGRKLAAYIITAVAIMLTAFIGPLVHLPQAAIESTQWSLTFALGVFSGANIGEHFSKRTKGDVDDKKSS